MPKNKAHCYIARLSLKKMSTVSDWLILGHVPLIKFKCMPTGIQLRSCCPHVEFCYMIV